MKNKRFLKVLSLLTNAAIVLTGCGGEKPKEDVPEEQKTYISGVYQNPLFVTNSSGAFYSNEIADPCVVRGDDGYLYAFATEGRVLRSQDGAEWQSYMENAIPRPRWGDGYATNPVIWAPDVVKIKDKWIYYYSLSAWGGPCGIGYAVADNVAGPWTDKGMLFASREVGGEYSLDVQNSIDSQVVLDGDDVYMVFGSFCGIYMVQLTEDGMGLYKGIEYQRENKILIAGSRGGWNSSTFEGSWIFKRNDLWYYMGSTGSCCNGKNSTYRVVCGVSDNIKGPYLDSSGRSLNKIDEVTYGDLVVASTPGLIAGPGHHSVVRDDAGDYWWYGHCYYEYDNFRTRHLAMDKLEFDENEMPYIKGYELSYNEELDGPRWLEE